MYIFKSKVGTISTFAKLSTKNLFCHSIIFCTQGSASQLQFKFNAKMRNNVTKFCLFKYSLVKFDCDCGSILIDFSSKKKKKLTLKKVRQNIDVIKNCYANRLSNFS